MGLGDLWSGWVGGWWSCGGWVKEVGLIVSTYLVGRGLWVAEETAFPKEGACFENGDADLAPFDHLLG